MRSSAIAVLEPFATIPAATKGTARPGYCSRHLSTCRCLFLDGYGDGSAQAQAPFATQSASGPSSSRPPLRRAPRARSLANRRT